MIDPTRRALTRFQSRLLSHLADELRGLPPSCGPVRLVAIDGHAGSGKTTFAAHLAEALRGAPVLHLDDIGTHDELFAWTERLLSQVIEPLRHGGTARYRPYDWHARDVGPERVLGAARVILVEGVGAGRRALRPYLARLLWMDLTPERSWDRGRDRDGAEQSAFWEEWVAAERKHFADDPSCPFAQLLVLQRPEGYEIRPGPAATAGANSSVTERHRPMAGS